MAAQDMKSDVFKFVALRPPSAPTADSATVNFIRDSRNAVETPVGRFVAQFNPENAATFPDKLKTFIAQQKYSLNYPQDAADNTFDQTTTAANGVPAGSITAASLKAAIEGATGQPLATLVTSPAAVDRQNRLWDNYYAFYLLSGMQGQDLGSLTSNLRSPRSVQDVCEHLLPSLRSIHPVRLRLWNFYLRIKLIISSNKMPTRFGYI